MRSSHLTRQEWILSSAGALLCLLSVAGVFRAEAASLSDISNSGNEEAIQSLYDQGIISGYADGSFKPKSTVNRAELAKILVGASGATPAVDAYHDCFSDVTTEWFAPYVCYAKEQGWVNGYPDGTFRPEQTVSKVEAIKMVVTSQGYTVTTGTEAGAFQDVDTSAWYAPYVQVALDKGLLEEEGQNALEPTAGMKRENISENIYRALSIKKSGTSRFEGGNRGNTGARTGSESEDLQQYLDAANAASDRTELTKTEFETALQSLMRQGGGGERRDPPDQNSSQRSSRPTPPSGQMPPDFGQMSSGMIRSAGAHSERPEGGGGPQNDLSSASTFLKYTDTSGQTILLALDSSGKVIMKWPSSGRGP
ncbi:MAG: S-layer homology domain-containing protein [Candidatus Peribacteraceae bacterium]|nr:S-layer homology domain-containing protein [Candidatus Peribacteraceae bacterium]MDD5742878.1 S-layer homology domain-containing protein [Candidatus Peribacteraceae bacterium]